MNLDKKKKIHNTSKKEKDMYIEQSKRLASQRMLIDPLYLMCLDACFNS
jgi:hypothetical protein